MSRAGLRRVALLALVMLPLTGCLTYPPGWEAEQGSDPYQGMNRAFFSFNEGVDAYVLGPIASGWTFITPKGFRVHLDKFFHNLGYPARLFANLGQGKLVGAGSETGRFLVNTTVGLLGFFDPASSMGLEAYNEDFGQMFGAWGLPPGPYWVVPLLGPSNPRDFFGGIFDLVFNFRNNPFMPGAGLVATVNSRAIADPQIESAREAALDYYVFVRDGYIERRRVLVDDLDRMPVDGEAELEDGESLYDESLYEVDESLYEGDDSLYEVDESLEEPGEAGADGEAAPEPGPEATTEEADAFEE